MSTKFFNNQNGNTLSAKLRAIAGTSGMGERFRLFRAVTGYFRSSGYFKLRRELVNVSRIQILVGMEMDDLFRKQSAAGEMFFGMNQEEAKERYTKSFVADVRDAGYHQEIEEGILQFCEDVIAGRLEMRVHKSRNLHAKFYLCLPEHHNENSDGWVIMGSSNLSDSGLGTTSAPRYELNVAMKDYDDVSFCNSEFESLWAEGEPISPDDIASARAATHLGQAPTPFEIFMRVLIDILGDMAEDGFSMDLPPGMRDLKYQRDAVVHGYSLLRKHDGFFLADVVGLGKTIVSAMIAKRFIGENGPHTKILVIFPPPVEDNWKTTFERFGITRRQAHFVSNGSLHKVLDDNAAGFLAPEEYDLVIVDESHGYRNANTKSFDQLQRICRAPRPLGGNVAGFRKKVILVTATALNNSPTDILNQIRLFQYDRESTIDGVRDLPAFFAPLIKAYKDEVRKAKASGSVDVDAIDAIYGKIREGVLEKIMVRRTRQNILNDTEYGADLKAQGVVFPFVEPPREVLYRMDSTLATLFTETNRILTDDLHYARYRAIEFLSPAFRKRYPNAKQIATTLAAVFRIHMVKRLESSFFAFRKSLDNFCRMTQEMIDMFAVNSVLIIPDLDVSGYLEKGKTFEEIVAIAGTLRGYKEKDISYAADDFDHVLLAMLREDLSRLEGLKRRWSKVRGDPKLDEFVALLNGELFERSRNPGGKLVVFSESTDTLGYLERELASRLGRADILMIDADNRGQHKADIDANFDANFEGEKRDDYNILLCSDALAEGVNLHRSNIVVNYDSPWNATRLMQRIGRVNRIGSIAMHVWNYIFYPSDQGNRVIGLYEHSLAKMQGFHSALGEDSKIYSREELLREFALYNTNPHDDIDDLIRYFRILQRFRADHPADYARIKALPVKCRVARRIHPASERRETQGTAERASQVPQQETLVYLSAPSRTAFYSVFPDAQPRQLSSVEMLRRLEADAKEQSAVWTDALLQENYKAVNAATALLEGTATASEEPIRPAGRGAGKQVNASLGFLSRCRLWISQGRLDAALGDKIDSLRKSVEAGMFHNLETELYNLNLRFTELPSENEAEVLAEEGSSLHALYAAVSVNAPRVLANDLTLIASETFTPSGTPASL